MVEAVGDFGVGAVGFFALKKLESFLLLPPQTLHRSWEKKHPLKRGNLYECAM